MSNPNLKTPYTQQWNLTIERQDEALSELRASYAGSRSIGLLYGRNLNEPVPSTTPFTTALFPNQLYSGISYYDNGGTDSYNSLELLVQKKLGKNLTFNTGFTWAKDLTDAQDSGGGGGSFAGQTIQNQFCLTCTKGPTMRSCRHVGCMRTPFMRCRSGRDSECCPTPTD